MVNSAKNLVWTMNTTSAKKIKNTLLMGGTFDPIHLGHTQPAEETALWLGADKIALIPAHIPPHKSSTHATANQRSEMAALVCQSHSLFELDTRELQRDTHSYTVDTLEAIKNEQPENRLHFIMGTDSLFSFTHWKHWQKILTLCHLVVNIRPGYSHQRLEDSLCSELHSRVVHSITELEKYETGKIILHECTALDISSTQIRHNIKSGQQYSQSVEQTVYKYIEQQQLYR